jgi:hypothetical protein
MLSAHPGIEKRSLHHAARDWDALHWLLSPERRKTGRWMAGDDLGSAFVCGARVIEGARATQGDPIRMTPADRVESVIRFAEAIDEGVLRQTLAKEPFPGVYKTAPAAELDEESWRAMMRYFTELRALHRAVADRGEALLVVFD